MPKGPGYGVTEGAPTMVVKVKESLRRRTLLTVSAAARGKALAEAVKPLLAEQTDAIVEMVNCEQGLKHIQTIKILKEETEAVKERRDAAVAAAASAAADLEG